MDRNKLIMQTTWVGFGVNMLLTFAKFAAGILGRSGAMVADAIHSLSDFVTDLVILFFVKLSTKPKDEDHDYGHGKYETLATVFIGLVLFAVAIGIIVHSAENIASVVRGETIERPDLIAVIAAVISIICKEALYWYTILIARRTDSAALKANAWHHRSDALSSIGTLLGIGGAYFLSEPWRVLDPIAAIVVGVLVIKVAYDIVMPGVNELLERSLPNDQEQEIETIVLNDTRLSDLHNLKTRRIGSGIAIEFHVRVKGEMRVDDAHTITHEISDKLKTRFGENTHVIVNIEPQKTEKTTCNCCQNVKIEK